jgi:hypothetical protein
LVSDIPAGDGKIVNLFYSVETTVARSSEVHVRAAGTTFPKQLPLMIKNHTLTPRPSPPAKLGRTPGRRTGRLTSILCGVPRATFCKHTTGLIVTKEARGVGETIARRGKRIGRKEGAVLPPFGPLLAFPFCVEGLML